MHEVISGVRNLRPSTANNLKLDLGTAVPSAPGDRHDPRGFDVALRDITRVCEWEDIIKYCLINTYGFFVPGSHGQLIKKFIDPFDIDILSRRLLTIVMPKAYDFIEDVQLTSLRLDDKNRIYARDYHVNRPSHPAGYPRPFHSSITENRSAGFRFNFTHVKIPNTVQMYRPDPIYSFSSLMDYSINSMNNDLGMEYERLDTYPFSGKDTAGRNVLDVKYGPYFPVTVSTHTLHACISLLLLRALNGKNVSTLASQFPKSYLRTGSPGLNCLIKDEPTWSVYRVKVSDMVKLGYGTSAVGIPKESPEQVAAITSLISFSVEDYDVDTLDIHVTI